MLRCMTKGCQLSNCVANEQLTLARAPGSSVLPGGGGRFVFTRDGMSKNKTTYCGRLVGLLVSQLPICGTKMFVYSLGKNDSVLVQPIGRTFAPLTIGRCCI